MPATVKTDCFACGDALTFPERWLYDAEVNLFVKCAKCGHDNRFAWSVRTRTGFAMPEPEPAIYHDGQ